LGTLVERVRLEAQLLKPDEHFPTTATINTKGLAPGDYRVESFFIGWIPRDCSDSDRAEVAKMGAPLLSGAAKASARITLTR
jgi:hypothetical protein